MSFAYVRPIDTIPQHCGTNYFSIEIISEHGVNQTANKIVVILLNNLPVPGSIEGKLITLLNKH